MEKGDDDDNISTKQLLEYDCAIKRAARHAKARDKLQRIVLYTYIAAGIILVYLRTFQSGVYTGIGLVAAMCAFITLHEFGLLRRYPRVFSGVLDMREDAALEYATFLYRLFERELFFDELTTLMALPVNKHPGF